MIVRISKVVKKGVDAVAHILVDISTRRVERVGIVTFMYMRPHPLTSRFKTKKRGDYALT